MAIEGEEEKFLTRWSRLKREQVRAPGEAAKATAPAPASEARADAPGEPVLPPLESLTPDSDFTAFMNPKVADTLRRAALKKLFRHPEINVPDPFEPFCNDLTGSDPIPDEILKSLLDARDALTRRPEAQAEEAQRQPEERAQPAEQATRQGAEAHAQPEADAPERSNDTGRQDA